MELFKSQNFIFIFLLILYSVPLLVGYFLKKSNNDIKVKGLNIIEQKLADPITIKLYDKTQRVKKIMLLNEKYLLLFLVIVFQRLLIALITRVLYGVIFIIPIFLTIWNGFSRGVLLESNKKNISSKLLIDDFIYILASVVGINFGSQIFSIFLLEEKMNLKISLNYLIYTIILIVIIVIIETIFIIKKERNQS